LISNIRSGKVYSDEVGFMNSARSLACFVLVKDWAVTKDSSCTDVPTRQAIYYSVTLRSVRAAIVGVEE